ATQPAVLHPEQQVVVAVWVALLLGSGFRQGRFRDCRARGLRLINNQIERGAATVPPRADDVRDLLAKLLHALRFDGEQKLQDLPLALAQRAILLADVLLV